MAARHPVAVLIQRDAQILRTIQSEHAPSGATSLEQFHRPPDAQTDAHGPAGLFLRQRPR